MPYQKSWKYGLSEFKLNLIHQLTNSLIVIPFAKYIIEWSNQYLLIQPIWPVNWSIPFQIILAVLIADFCIYLSHRFMHSSRIGWRIHAIHHTTIKMNFLAASRSHPFNAFIIYSLEVGLMLLLGIPEIILVTWTVFMSAVGLFSHSNIDLKWGLFNTFLVTPEVHRVHHHLDWNHSNSNFGNTTCLWDRLFGTYMMPKENILVQGLKEYTIPANYRKHLTSPFTLKRYANKT
jgi:sterol desaturase/sphingolipid hydroxylase (fatty acid hydroxylase superfamily)